jgi:CreA protein
MSNQRFSRVQQHTSVAFLVALVAGFLAMAHAEELGKVDTRFRLLSPDDTIRVEAIEDPKIEGVVCYLSRAQIGGYAGAIGVAEDSSDGSLECAQVGPVRILEPFEKGERVFRERRSLLFKSMKVIRYCDMDHNTLVYLVYSEKLIDGSPKNSVSAVPLRPWPGADTNVPQCAYNRNTH